MDSGIGGLLEDTLGGHLEQNLTHCARLNIKAVFLRNGDSHVKDKTVVRQSYL